jgi:hypothetical protein
MKIKLISLILLLTTACTFQVDVLDTPAPQPTQAVISPATPTLVISPEASATPLPLPTLTPTNTAESAPIGNTDIVPIQFGPNGTYVDILDSILAGKSKTYSIKALKGQMMSISIRQHDVATLTSMTMRIVGADDSVLCASDCRFWRGVLPATEDYFVTVTAAADALSFTMRVAIDPPGTTSQSFVYENKYRNATISYTDVLAPGFFPGAPMTKIEPELTLQYIDTQVYTNTNLIEAYFVFGSSTDAQLVSTCTEPLSIDTQETIVGDITVDDVTFTKGEASGVGAGNIYEQTYFRAVHNGTCFEVTYFIHYGNIGNYSSGVQEFDKATLLQQFDKTLSTLKFE